MAVGRVSMIGRGASDFHSPGITGPSARPRVLRNDRLGLRVIRSLCPAPVADYRDNDDQCEDDYTWDYRCDEDGAGSTGQL